MIDNNIEHLKEPFRSKCRVFLQVIHTRFPNVKAFETLRSKSRQALLFAQRKSWTLNSKHLTGLACDWVFMVNYQPTWKGDYYLLQRVAHMCGMDRIKQELCHTQDDGKSISEQMKDNSARYNATSDAGERHWLHLVNDTFRTY
jgi:hypothetical protein